jgi:phosphoserine phosphatase
MEIKSDDSQHYTGLILLSGVDAPGVASKLFAVLEPFSIRVLDIEQLVIRSRLILTVLIDLDPAHAEAIEKDLNQCANDLDVDIATSFGAQSAKSIEEKPDLMKLTVSAEKITPGLIAKIATEVCNAGANIENIQRVASLPQTTFELIISGANQATLQKSLEDNQKLFEFKFIINKKE